MQTLLFDFATFLLGPKTYKNSPVFAFSSGSGGGPGEGPRLVFEHAWLGISSVFSWFLLPGRGAKAIQNVVFYGLLGHF